MKAVFVWIQIDQDVGQSKGQSLLNLQVVQKPKSILEDSTLKTEIFIGMI
jgi:hypothetical protein